MTQTAAKGGIISDASVLIDYAKSAPNILKLTSAHIEQLYVALPVLREVDQLSIDDAGRLGMKVIEPTIVQFTEAVQLQQTKPALSWQDTLCFVLARDNGLACLTTDKPLRNYCLANNISCLWGFEIMIPLISCGKLDAEKAYKIAQDIRSKNKYIRAETVEKFREILGL